MGFSGNAANAGDANVAIARIDLDDKDAEKKVSTYLTKYKKFPAFVCQEVMNGFAKFWEVKSFWLNGKFTSKLRKSSPTLDYLIFL